MYVIRLAKIAIRITRTIIRIISLTLLFFFFFGGSGVTTEGSVGIADFGT